MITCATWSTELKALNLRRPPQHFNDLPEAEQFKRVKQRVKSYSHTVYKKYTKEKVVEKEAIVCQRENPFYVDTVKAFRCVLAPLLLPVGCTVF